MSQPNPQIVARIKDSKEDIEKYIDGYCNCGAKHGTIDGDYICNKGCYSNEIRKIVNDIIKLLKNK